MPAAAAARLMPLPPMHAAATDAATTDAAATNAAARQYFRDRPSNRSFETRGAFNHRDESDQCECSGHRSTNPTPVNNAVTPELGGDNVNTTTDPRGGEDVSALVNNSIPGGAAPLWAGQAPHRSMLRLTR